MNICTAEGCGLQQRAKGYCSTHYSRIRRNGHLDIIDRSDPRNATEKFWDLVRKTDSCWEWSGPKHKQGYGFLCIGRGRMLAHRFSYELHYGPIPDGLHIDHRCFNQSCTRPEHLRLATNKQNHENLPGAMANSRSGVRGVHWSSSSKKWLAVVTHNGKRHLGGYFDTIPKAEAAVVALRLRLFTHNDLDRQQQGG